MSDTGTGRVLLKGTLTGRFLQKQWVGLGICVEGSLSIDDHSAPSIAVTE